MSIPVGRGRANPAFWRRRPQDEQLTITQRDPAAAIMMILGGSCTSGDRPPAVVVRFVERIHLPMSRCSRGSPSTTVPPRSAGRGSPAEGEPPSVGTDQSLGQLGMRHVRTEHRILGGRPSGSGARRGLCARSLETNGLDPLKPQPSNDRCGDGDDLETRCRDTGRSLPREVRLLGRRSAMQAALTDSRHGDHVVELASDHAAVRLDVRCGVIWQDGAREARIGCGGNVWHDRRVSCAPGGCGGH